MKILHLVNTFAAIGGVETYVLKLLPLLAQRGHGNVVVYRQAHARTPVMPDATVFHVPVTAVPAPGRAQVLDIIRQERPSIIYMHDVYDPELIAQAAQLAPAVGYVHIFYPVCPGLGKLYRQGDAVCERPYGLGCVPKIYLRRCASARDPRSVYRIMQQTGRYLAAYRSLPRIVVGTAYMKALMIQNGIAAERIDILPPHFVTDVSDEPLSRPDESPPSILFVGRLAYEKGIPYLFQASQRIQAPHRLLIAGDGDLKESYQRLAAELGIADRVEFLGWLTDEALDAAYRRSAAAAMPTIMPEPFGKVGIEALANGRPVVAFNVGGIADWLQDGVNGYLVPPRDIDRLAARLERLLADVDLAMALGRNGRAFVRQQYQPQTHADRLTQIFETVVSNGR